MQIDKKNDLNIFPFIYTKRLVLLTETKYLCYCLTLYGFYFVSGFSNESIFR